MFNYVFHVQVLVMAKFVSLPPSCSILGGKSSFSVIRCYYDRLVAFLPSWHLILFTSLL